ncbi:MAG: hypothetical protein KGL39_54745, partial [Patescibacteria group bacterium]|nr:hypothetical protein [Patescibacteria group bacterium]
MGYELFKAAQATAVAKAQAPLQPKAPPEPKVLEGASLRTTLADGTPILTDDWVPQYTTYMAQVTVCHRQGNLHGATTVMAGRALRMEITRLLNLEEADEKTKEQAFSWMKQRVGPRDYDMEFRPEHRVTSLMFRNAPPTMQNKAPWAKAYDAVFNAVMWARDTCNITRKDMGIILMITTEVNKEDSHEGYQYTELNIVGVSFVEAIVLQEDRLLP